MTIPILGINCYAHDSAAAIIVDGKVIAAAEEERFTRRKHTGAFPLESIRFCLTQAGLSISDIREVAFSFDPYLQFRKRLIHGLRFLDRRLIFGRHASSVFLPFFLKQKFRFAFGGSRKVNFNLHYVNHHMAHAASVFYTSPFEKAAILTVDGAGEWATTVLGIGEGNQIKPLAETCYPHSLGFFYGTLTQYLGFRSFKDEGKIMTLAAYAEPAYKEEFKKLIQRDSKGSFRMNMKYFDFHFGATRWYSKELETLLGPARRADSPLEERHYRIAATLQWMTEEILLGLTQTLSEKTGLKNLCLAGGVALNCSANGMLLRRSPFEKIFVQPACGDAGTSVGAALYAHYGILQQPRQADSRLSAYLGPEYKDAEIEQVLKSSPLHYERIDNLEERVAAEISQGRTVGWFQGRMEFGPRALGARSILADPRTADRRHYINREIKHRELFRPFGPSVLEEQAHHFFDIRQASPFMLFATSVHADQVSRIQGVVHEDSSARIQTVSREGTPPRYRALLEAYERLTGIPMLLNTSFNMRDEPIVCSPQDAVRSFGRSKLDFLALGPYLAWKKEAPNALKLSIIIPVYNEWKTIRELLEKLLALRLEKEIIIVDDGSNDGTTEIVESIRHPLVRIFHHARNQGKGAAIRTALQYVSGDMVLIQDGDLEQDPEDIYHLVEPMLQKGAQVVYGSRFIGQKPHMKRRAYLANRLISGFASLLYGKHITDVETCYKLFRVDILKSISWEANRFEFEPEITARLLRRGVAIHEVPIKEDWFHGYDNNTKKVTWKDGVKALATLFKYRFQNFEKSQKVSIEKLQDSQRNRTFS